MSQPPLIASILNHYRGDLKTDYTKYYNHCCRVYLLATQLYSFNEIEEEQIAIAAAFHDLGIWSHHTFDYLNPSCQLATLYLEKKQKSDWIEPVTLMIDNHHKLRPYTQLHRHLVEAFRKADLIDLSYGLIKFNVPTLYFKKLYQSYPPVGFHRKIGGLIVKNIIIRPFNPLPIVKW